MTLSARARDIVLCLLEDPTQPITVASLARQLQISTRTAQRTLPEVSDWLQSQGVLLEAKSGTGLLLYANPAQCDVLRESLSAPLPLQLSRSERRRQLLWELLYEEEPVKSAWLCSHFGISGGTLSGDLDALSEWAKPYGLTLSRQSGIGIHFTGNEAAIRSATAAAICSFTDSKQLLQLLRGTQEETDHPGIPQLLPPAQRAQLESILSSAEAQLGITLTDSGFAALFVHLALVQKRLSAGERIVMPPGRLARLRLLPEYAAGEAIADAMQEAFSLTLPPDEIGFITMHLAGSSVRTRAGRDWTQLDIDVHRIAHDMTQLVEARLGVSFSGNESLLEGLCNHLEPVIHRLQLGTPIENSEWTDIRDHYPRLYDATREACHVLCRELEIPSVPDTEIAFLAAHFGAAIESLHARIQTVCAVVVCPTGVGTSRLLAAALARTFPQLQLRGTQSSFSLDAAALHRDGIDLIISTVDLDIRYRFIRVSPILSERDKMLLRTVVDTLAQQKKSIPTAQPAAQALTRAQVTRIGYLGQELAELLDHLILAPPAIAHTHEELIALAAALFADNDISADILAQQLRTRDALGDTYIKPLLALLLHCRTDQTVHCRFGYVRLNPPFYERGRLVMGAVVMLLPASADPVSQGLMSELSGLLLDHTELLDAMRHGEQDVLTRALTSLLLAYYRRTVSVMLEGGAPDG